MRFWEIDAFRAVALVLMVLFNYSFTLSYLGIFRIADGWLYWWLFPRIIASMFIFAAGISLTISYSRRKSVRRLMRRGLWIFSLGLLITAATWILAPRDTIYFGILHFVGFSITISPLFIKMKKINLLLSALTVLVVASVLEGMLFDFPWLLWLGFLPAGFRTLDYFPVFPWFSVILIGMYFGREFYENGNRKFKMPEEKRITKPLTFIGSRTLLVYIAHQPVLLATLYAFGLI